MQAGPLQPSGRVIAGGRLLLACLFLVAVWVESSQPTRPPEATYGLLIAYVAWALGVTMFVWNDWWNDARLAAPAHVIDVAIFMLMLYSTEGFTSPFFIFFVFILLAAAIRWGWQETAITAAVIIAVFFIVGLLAGGSQPLESERFILRIGHLFIISAILVWFGANQWLAWPRFLASQAVSGPASGIPFEAALQACMKAIRADRGLVLWREDSDKEAEVFGLSISRDGKPASVAGVSLPQLTDGLLFDLPKDRVLMRADASRWRFLRASGVLPAGFAELVGGGKGLAVPFAGGTMEGLAVFQDVRALSTDHLDLAVQLARDIATRLQEAALFAAVEERSMAKARVAVARDLHDSVVQFLAGIGFQLEALNRSPQAKGAIGTRLAELKEAVMTEQRHLRAFIHGLRTGGSVSLRTLSRDCVSLCELLARQWSIDCSYDGKAGAGSVTMRTQLDVHHLVREGVANAARHGGAKQVRVSLSGNGSQIHLTIADDGCGFASDAAEGNEIAVPASLSARVREAGGDLKVTTEPGQTTVVIRLPVDGPA